MIKSNFNTKLNLLETIFAGTIDLEHLVEHVIHIGQNNDYPKKLKIITDATNATFNFSVADLNAVNSEKNKSLDNYETVVDAIIIDSPETAAISVIYEALAQNKKYSFKVFSTKEAALFWLGNF